MYVKGGENTFMPDDDDPQMPGKEGLEAIGGVVTHLQALTAIGCSTVNSYRRLWDTGFWAPVFADWGFQNRTTGLRVSAPGRFEYRSVDSMVNPYLMGTTLLAAMDDGIDNKLDPGEPEERNIYEAIKEGKDVKKLPMSLGEALEYTSRNPKSSVAACRARCTVCTTSTSTTNMRASCRPSPIGTTTPTWNACRKRAARGGCAPALHITRRVGAFSPPTPNRRRPAKCAELQDLFIRAKAPTSATK